MNTTTMRRAIAVPIASAGLLHGVAHARPVQPEPATPAARSAIVLCQQADQAAPGEPRAAVLRMGLQRAEQALLAAPADPVAHFAVFCNLGKQLATNQRAGWFARLGSIRRVRKEIDVALALAPDYVEALAAKGALLVQLPAALGGDLTEGKHLLRRAVALQPADAQVRAMLAATLRDRGHDGEADVQAAIGHDSLNPAASISAAPSSSVR
jgi:hypothetical protein